ncbi:hypothetical protein ACFS27_13660 [Promicromonospora vindobonensis]|uniref:Arc/MetJ-type ribon-helix-helix transcriptional regulator n=1 Tax=Promicromonospora vindobonensis TaxID=195748 RepID=A0ABW5VSC8_9MICO
MATQSGEPRKIRWTVPAVDTSVIAWLDAQTKPTQSLRWLVREAIQHHGYTDVVYQPVEQLPHLGHPTQAEQSDDGPSSSPAPRDEESAPAPADDSEESTQPAKQVSIDEIMSSTRR